MLYKDKIEMTEQRIGEEFGGLNTAWIKVTN